MKFDCGESWGEKCKRLAEWHDFYAIWPRWLESHDCRCFETIQRKGNYIGPEYGWDWVYRAKQ